MIFLKLSVGFCICMSFSLFSQSSFLFTDGFELGAPSSEFITYEDIHDGIKIVKRDEFFTKNLLKNPSFEQNGIWKNTCGQTLYTTENKTDGLRALEISKKNGCESDFTGSSRYAISQSGISLNKNADYFTVTFDINFNKYIDMLGGGQTFQVFIDNNDHVAKDRLITDTSVTYYHSMTNGWRQVQFIISREKIESRFEAPNKPDWSNLTFSLIMGGISTESHVIYLDNLRLSEGRIDEYGFDELPLDLRKSNQRVLISSGKGDEKHIGSMMVGGKDVKLYKAIKGDFYSRPSAIADDILVGNQFITEKSPGDGEPPAGKKRFPVFSVRVERFGLDGRPTKDSPVHTFLGVPGLLNSDFSTFKQGLGYQYYGSVVSEKHRRGVLASCAQNYYDAATGEPSSIFCGGLLTNDKFEPIKDKKGENILMEGTNFAISSKTWISAFTKSNRLRFYKLSGEAVGEVVPDGNLLSQAWASRNEYLAVLTSDGGGHLQSAEKDEYSLIPMLTIYDVKGESLDYLYRYPMEFLTNDEIMWTRDDKYILFNRAYVVTDNKGKKTEHRELWWLEVATGKRGQITTELPVTAESIAP